MPLHGPWRTTRRALLPSHEPRARTRHSRCPGGRCGPRNRRRRIEQSEELGLVDRDRRLPAPHLDVRPDRASAPRVLDHSRDQDSRCEGVGRAVQSEAGEPAGALERARRRSPAGGARDPSSHGRHPVPDCPGPDGFGGEAARLLRASRSRARTDRAHPRSVTIPRECPSARSDADVLAVAYSCRRCRGCPVRAPASLHARPVALRVALHPSLRGQMDFEHGQRLLRRHADGSSSSTRTGAPTTHCGALPTTGRCGPR